MSKNVFEIFSYYCGLLRIYELYREFVVEFLACLGGKLFSVLIRSNGSSIFFNLSVPINVKFWWEIGIVEMTDYETIGCRIIISTVDKLCMYTFCILNSHMLVKCEQASCKTGLMY